MLTDSSPTISDGTIIEAVRSGETDRFEVLVHRYQRSLLRAARSRLGRDDWAEDVVQETFLAALKWLGSYDSRFSFRTWLWTILLNQCRRHYQKRSRQPSVRCWSEHSTSAADHAAVASGEPAPSAALIGRERLERVEQLLARLPEPQADALRLRFYGELKFQEIADAMGCSLSTAKNRVRWGLTKLSQMIAADESQAVVRPRDIVEQSDLAQSSRPGEQR